MAKCEKILIAGFAGAGKSSFLREIAQGAGPDWTFADLDELVVKTYGGPSKSLSEWIEEWGWDRFRSYEEECLRDWLTDPGKGVLALGGGSLNEENVNLVSQKAKILVLEVDFETAWHRVQMDPQVRPLALKGENYMRYLFEKRQKIFEKVPWKMANSDGTDLKALAAAFWREIR
ncbi:MAG: shikimate kinase [Bacteriovoracaceae bacterium]